MAQVFTSNRVTVVVQKNIATVLRDGHHVWQRWMHTAGRPYKDAEQIARAAIRGAIEEDAISALDVVWRSKAREPWALPEHDEDEYVPSARRRWGDLTPEDLLDYHTDRDETEDIVFDR